MVGVSSVSVVIDALHVGWSLVGPAKADPKLVVHSNRVLPHAIAPERFEPVARRCQQVPKRNRVVEELELALDDGLNVTEAARPSAFEDRLGLAAAEGLNH